MDLGKVNFQVISEWKFIYIYANFHKIWASFFSRLLFVAELCSIFDINLLLKVQFSEIGFLVFPFRFLSMKTHE